jgi:hypothetical protein
MSSPSDDRPKLAREDEGFVKRVAESYAPPPMTAAERAAFDETLLERIQRSHPTRRWLTLAGVPAAVGAALAAAWLFFLSPETEGLAPSEGMVPALSARAWEEELFLDDASLDAEQTDESELLPEEYVALASFFLDR